MVPKDSCRIRTLHEKDGVGKIERKHRDSKGEQYGVITKKFFLCVIF